MSPHNLTLEELLREASFKDDPFIDELVFWIVEGENEAEAELDRVRGDLEDEKDLVYETQYENKKLRERIGELEDRLEKLKEQVGLGKIGVDKSELVTLLSGVIENTTNSDLFTRARQMLFQIK